MKIKKNSKTRFIFTIEECDGNIRKVFLLGCGGLYGSGYFWVSENRHSTEYYESFKNRVLMRARVELNEYGYVREFIGDHLPINKRIKNISPKNILDISLI